MPRPDPDIIDIYPGDISDRIGRVRQINSSDGAAQEKSEEEKRITRERNRQLAENKANDELVEARAAYDSFKRGRRAAWTAVGASSAVGGGVVLVEQMVGFSGFFIAIFIMACFVLVVGSGTILNLLMEQVEYKHEKKVRDAENNYRDVVTRPISHYRSE